MEQFEVLSKISDIETIAWGHGIKILPLLLKKHGGKPSAANPRHGGRKKAGQSFANSEFYIKPSCIGMKHTASVRWT